jgi:peptidoglycan/LPS O-acetylase OafA/YrhL
MNSPAIQDFEIEPGTRALVSVAASRLIAVSEAPQKSFYRPELVVLRFFAFLSVFLHHGLPGFELAHHHGFAARLALWETAFKEAARFGVCLFFMLSAYLITELLCREISQTGRVHVTAFYSRRILRIWPLYFAFLFFGVIVGWFFRGYYVEEPRLWAFLLLSGNWYVAAAGCSASPIAPLWSISVEEQFYLIWPWIARLGGKRLIAVISLFLVPTSILFLYWLSRRGVEASHVTWVNSLVKFQFFAIGSLIS